MIFNLLFGSPIKALNALAYLREKKIKPIEFADLLCQEANLYLLNRFVNEKDKKEVIRKLIEDKFKEQVVNILFEGDESADKFIGQNDSFNSGIAIHPSGVNLNFDGRRKRYLSNWIECNDSELKYPNNNIIKIDSFKIFS